MSLGETSDSYPVALSRVHVLEQTRDVRGLILMLDNPIEESPESTVRAAAARALARIGDGRAAPGLVGLLNDASARVRFTAAYALGHAGDAASCIPLLGAVDDEDQLVRDAAIISLGTLGCADAVPRLLTALDAEAPWTRLHAAEALLRLGGPLSERDIGKAVKRESVLAPVRRWRWRKLRRNLRRRHASTVGRS